MDQEEGRLVERAVAGDAQAFRDLLDCHYMTVYRMAFRFCGTRHDAEDVTQMACMKLAAQIQTFKGQSSFTTWLYTVVLNTARDWQRSQGRHQRGHVGIENADDATGSQQSPEQALATRQQLARVNALPEPEREAVLLVFAEGLSHKQAAEILGCAESTISWRIHEARRKLAAQEGDRKHG